MGVIIKEHWWKRLKMKENIGKLNNEYLRKNEYGSKAGVLLHLLKYEDIAGLIPDSLFVSGELFAEFLSQKRTIKYRVDNIFCELREAKNYDTFQFICKKNNNLQNEIEKSFKLWLLKENGNELIKMVKKKFENKKIALRSSGYEDYESFSNAGGNISILNVDTADIIENFAKVCAGYFSEKSLLQLYKESAKEEDIFIIFPSDSLKFNCPVLIQEMLDITSKYGTEEKLHFPLLSPDILDFLAEKVNQIKDILGYEVVDTEWVLKGANEIISIVAFNCEPYLGADFVTLSCSFGVASSSITNRAGNNTTYIIARKSDAMWYVVQRDSSVIPYEVKLDKDSLYLLQARSGRRQGIVWCKNNNFEDIFNYTHCSDSEKIGVPVCFKGTLLNRGKGDGSGKIIAEYTIAEVWNEYLRLSEEEQNKISACVMVKGSMLEHAGIMLSSQKMPAIQLNDKDYLDIKKYFGCGKGEFFTELNSARICFVEKNSGYSPKYESVSDTNYEAFLGGTILNIGFDEYKEIGQVPDDLRNNERLFRNLECTLLYQIQEGISETEKLYNKIKMLVVEGINDTYQEIDKGLNEFIKISKVTIDRIKTLGIPKNVLQRADCLAKCIEKIACYIKYLLTQKVEKESEVYFNSKGRELSFSMYILDLLINNNNEMVSDYSGTTTSIVDTSLTNFWFSVLDGIISTVKSSEELKSIINFLSHFEKQNKFVELIDKCICYYEWNCLLSKNYKDMLDINLQEQLKVRQLMKMIGNEIITELDPSNFYKLYSFIKSLNDKECICLYMVNALKYTANIEFLVGMAVFERQMKIDIIGGSNMLTKYRAIVGLLNNIGSQELSVLVWQSIKCIRLFGGFGDCERFIDAIRDMLSIKGDLREIEYVMQILCGLKVLSVEVYPNELIEKYHSGIFSINSKFALQCIDAMVSDVTQLSLIIYKKNAEGFWNSTSQRYIPIWKNILANIVATIIELLDIWAKVYAHSLSMDIAGSYSKYFSVVEIWTGLVSKIFFNKNKEIDRFIAYTSKCLDHLNASPNPGLTIDINSTWEEKLQREQTLNIHELHNVLHQGTLYFRGELYPFEPINKVMEIHKAMQTFGRIDRHILRNMYECIEIELGLGKIKVHKSSITISSNYIMAHYTEAPTNFSVGRLPVLKKLFSLIASKYPDYSFFSFIHKDNRDEILKINITKKDSDIFDWYDVMEVSQLIRAIFDSVELGHHKENPDFEKLLLNEAEFFEFFWKFIGYHKKLQFTKFMPYLGGGASIRDDSVCQPLLSWIAFFPERFLVIKCKSYPETIEEMKKALKRKDWLTDWYEHKKWLRRVYGLILSVKFPEELLNDIITGKRIAIHKSNVLLYTLLRDDISHELMNLIIHNQKGNKTNKESKRFVNLLAKFNPLPLVDEAKSNPHIRDIIANILETKPKEYSELLRCYFSQNVEELFNEYIMKRSNERIDRYLSNFVEKGCIWVDVSQWSKVFCEESSKRLIISLLQKYSIKRVYDCRSYNHLLYIVD